MKGNATPRNEVQDPAWDKDSLPPEVTPVRRDPMVPRMIALASSLLALPAAVFIIYKLIYG